MTAWYPIASMREPHTPVRVSGTGFELFAEIRQHPKLSQVGKPVWFWFEITKAGKLVALAPVGVQGDRGPRLWQPLEPAQWPHELPNAVAGPVPPAPDDHPLPPEPDDGTTQGDGWPYPGLRLGALVPPVSLEECEARLLRAIRTMRSPAVAGIGGASDYAGDIPREMIKIGLRFAELERVAEEGDNELRAVRSAWAPTRRDMTDWLYAMDWLQGVNQRSRSILYLRSDDPPPSYTAITRHLGGTPQGIHQRYAATIEQVYRRVKHAR